MNITMDDVHRTASGQKRIITWGAIEGAAYRSKPLISFACGSCTPP